LASDFVQTVARPPQYATEVWNSAKRVGIAPDRFAAEHATLTPWSKVADVNRLLAWRSCRVAQLYRTDLAQFRPADEPHRFPDDHGANSWYRLITAPSASDVVPFSSATPTRSLFSGRQAA
jgi:hypothetical protein